MGPYSPASYILVQIIGRFKILVALELMKIKPEYKIVWDPNEIMQYIFLGFHYVIINIQCAVSILGP